MYREKKDLEDNLNSYKRQFVAELNRELRGRCSQMGSSLNTALMDVMGKIGELTEPKNKIFNKISASFIGCKINYTCCVKLVCYHTLTLKDIIIAGQNLSYRYRNPNNFPKQNRL